MNLKHRPMRLIICVFFFAVALQAGAAEFFAASVLEEKITFEKAKRIAGFHEVQTALNREDFHRALRAVKLIEPHVEFTDYYHYLAGQAELGLMRKQIAAKNYAAAIVRGEKAKTHFVQAQGGNPYTALQRRAGLLLGETEIALGESHRKLKRNSRAKMFYEDGFQRLSQINLLTVVPRQTLVDYALLCEKSKTDICLSWLVKFGPLLSRTEESRVIERVAAFKKTSIERPTPSIPYRVDLDLQAFQKAFTLYQEGKYDEAFSEWKQLLEEYPRTTIKYRTKFWMARAAQKSAHDAHAETLYREIIRDLPFSYYAMLSSWFSGIDLGRRMDAEVPLATTETPVLKPSDIVHLKRAEGLIASRVPELAMLELQNVQPSGEMPNEFLIYLTLLNHLAGNHRAAFSMFSELSNRNYEGLFSSYGQRIFFPTDRLKTVEEIAKGSKVDPLLVLSVIKQESAFQEQAVSVANALGLMQIIPPTARDLDPKLELMDLFRAQKNIKLGVKYLDQLLGRYKNNVVSTLAAYNAGPGNSDRWLKAAIPGAPVEEYIETITFRETREYVQSILRNYYWYIRRVKGEVPPNLSVLAQFVEDPKTVMLKTSSKRQPAQGKNALTH
ncbi:MAG: transglycosylase SLT domain-containing protein [Bdellovibrionota bacterium]